MEDPLSPLIDCPAPETIPETEALLAALASCQGEPSLSLPVAIACLERITRCLQVLLTERQEMTALLERSRVPRTNGGRLVDRIRCLIRERDEAEQRARIAIRMPWRRH